MRRGAESVPHGYEGANVNRLTDSDDVLLEARVGRVAVLTLNRPQAANALSPALIGSLNTALEAAELDDDVTAVVITGAGERVFCAGMDLKAFAEHDGGLELSDGSADMARRYRGAIPPGHSPPHSPPPDRTPG